MSARELITAAGKPFGLTYNEMIDTDRRPRFVYARAAAAFALRRRGMSYPQIGRCMHRDHSTVINYFKAHTRLLDAPDFAKLVDRLTKMPAFVLPDRREAIRVLAAKSKPKKLTPRQQFREGSIDGDQLNEAEFNAMLVRGSQALNAAIASQFQYTARAA